MSVTLIRKVRLTDPAAGVDGLRDVLVAFGRIAQIGENLPADEVSRGFEPKPGCESLTVIDGTGLWLWPGLVDGHVHFREPGFTEKETIRTGALAAAAGGYTSVVCEPNTDPPIDSVAMVRGLAQKAGAQAAVNVYFKAAMTKGRRGRELVNVRALARQGHVVALSDDGDPVVDPQVMQAICQAAGEARILLAPHCEDSPQAIRQITAGQRPGFEPAEWHANEANYIERDLALARDCGCPIHFSHVSLARSIQAVEQARAAPGGPAATFEVTPHHLLLCAEDFAEGAAPMVSPPLRSAEDRHALQRALSSGIVDAIASDHAPHTAADRARGACGLIGLETTLGLILTYFVDKGGLAPADAVRLMSWSPAKIFGLPAGTLTPCSPADMVIIDPQREWTVDPGAFRSKSRNCPFAGWQLRGKAVATYVNGEQVHAEPNYETTKTIKPIGRP